MTWPNKSPLPALQLLHGKELELRQMEHQVALLGEAALAEPPVAEPTAQASDPSAHSCANAATAAEEQENGAQQARMGQDRTVLSLLERFHGGIGPATSAFCPTAACCCAAAQVCSPARASSRDRRGWGGTGANANDTNEILSNGEAVE